VGNEGRNYGSHSVSVSEVVRVSDVGVSGHQVDGDLSLTLLTSVNSSGGMYSMSPGEGEVTPVSDLGRVVVRGGEGHVRVEGSHRAVRVGDKLGCGARN